MSLYKSIVTAIKRFSRKWPSFCFYVMDKPFLKSSGHSYFLGKDFSFHNHKYIAIGDKFVALQRCRIEAIDTYGGESFEPQIIIGDNVNFNTDIHIACINKVIIGNNVLLASRIFISDHSHGEVTKESISKAPSKRNLVSKGPVIIEDNVWIGEGVSILPNVTIGKNSIIGSNAVVTKSFPENSVIAGIPAILIKSL